MVLAQINTSMEYKKSTEIDPQFTNYFNEYVYEISRGKGKAFKQIFLKQLDSYVGKKECRLF